MAASGNTVVLLTNLDPPSTTTSTPNASQPDSAHQQPAHQLSTQQAPSLTNLNGAQSSTRPTHGNNTARPTPPIPAAAAGGPSQPMTQSSLLRFLLATWVGNAIAGLGLLVALAALGLTVFSSIVQVLSMKWSSRNDALSACIAWSSIGKQSTYCNATIAAGVTRPPITKRDAFAVGWTEAVLRYDTRTFTLVLTCASLVVLVLWFALITCVESMRNKDPDTVVSSVVRSSFEYANKTIEVLAHGTAFQTSTELHDNTQTGFRKRAGGHGTDWPREKYSSRRSNNKPQETDTVTTTQIRPQISSDHAYFMPNMYLSNHADAMPGADPQFTPRPQQEQTQASHALGEILKRNTQRRANLLSYERGTLLTKGHAVAIAQPIREKYIGPRDPSSPQVLYKLHGGIRGSVRPRDAAG